MIAIRPDYEKAGKDRILTGTGKSIPSPDKSQMKLILAYVMSQITNVKRELADFEKEKIEKRVKELEIQT